jgi:hypothetical protein
MQTVTVELARAMLSRPVVTLASTRAATILNSS